MANEQTTQPLTYLFIVPNYWGKGDSVEAAKKAARKAGASSFKTYVLYTCTDPDVYCDDFMGDIHCAKGAVLTLVEHRKGR